jgi:hypothetical protein
MAASMEPIPEDDFLKLTPQSMYQMYITAMAYAKTTTTLVQTLNLQSLTLTAPSKHAMTGNPTGIPPMQKPFSKQLPQATQAFNLAVLSDSIFKDVTAKDISPNSAILSWPGATTDRLTTNINLLEMEGKTFKNVLVNAGVCNIGDILRENQNPDPSEAATKVVAEIAQLADLVKTKMKPDNLYFAKLHETSGRYTNFNDIIKKANSEMETMGIKLIDLELYPDLLHDGLHPSYPAGVTEIVQSVKKVLRSTNTTVSPSVNISTPWRFQRERQPGPFMQRTQYPHQQPYAHQNGPMLPHAHHQPGRHGVTSHYNGNGS